MVSVSDFTERHLLSDYKFLEEASRLHDAALRSEVPRPARQLPLGLQQFVNEVRLPFPVSMLTESDLVCSKPPASVPLAAIDITPVRLF